ncbi:hypothetical protein PGB90_005516 [Kerria lacca]
MALNINNSTEIISVDAKDIRFPTSQRKYGSDAMVRKTSYLIILNIIYNN